MVHIGAMGDKTESYIPTYICEGTFRVIDLGGFQ